ncbi:NAD(P)-dependent oxidoreductase [Capsulimonas corticalis]|uniref:NAD(P)-dependent oxidoreductase n=1 Tax=Capsulimonas corticalis TaxID=2219043 RepID=A0A402D4F3_9BACT|nr:SDR family oxidoreductase [Capsulimonas corticalis]BDI29171.1 NAD(P)-dependent oxidoreductase [Capsulimonas corticalis]
MAATILITGANGTVGGDLTAELANHGVKIRAGVRSKLRARNIVAYEPELVEMDLARPDTFPDALYGIEQLFLLTPFTGGTTEIVQNLVNAAKAAGVSHIVRLSAYGADAEPGITLGRWHRAEEKIIQESGIPVTILRPNGFFQNFAEIDGRSIKTQNAIYSPVTVGKASFVDTRDIAAVAAKALTEPGHEGKIYEITGPEAISYTEIAEQLSTVTGRTISFVPVPEEAVRDGMVAAGAPEALADALVELFQLYEAGYAGRVLPTVEEITGKPARTFAQYAADYAAAFS